MPIVSTLNRMWALMQIVKITVNNRGYDRCSGGAKNKRYCLDDLLACIDKC